MKTLTFLRRYLIAFYLKGAAFFTRFNTPSGSFIGSIRFNFFKAVLAIMRPGSADGQLTSWSILLLVWSLLAISTSPAEAQFTPTLYRALNLYGPGTTIDGNSWQSSIGAANFNYSGNSFENQNIPLVPATDANRAAMIRSSLWGNPLALNVTSVPNGSYDVYLYTWADENPSSFSATLEGVQIISSFVSNGTGSWKKLGPFRTTISDGTVNLYLSGGEAVVSGLEIWTAPNPPVVSTPLPDQVIKTGESYTYVVPSTAFTDPDVGTTLTFTASLANGSALPGWLTFNASTRTFSGTPVAANAAALNVQVTAIDETGGSANDVFLLTINTGIYNLYRAINLNGSSLSIDGNTWEASGGAANLSITNNNVLSAPTALLSPPTDANRAAMIRTSVWGSLNVAVSSMPAGNYAIWVYTWEDNSPTNFSFTLEGTAAVTNYNSGAAGGWSKLGPFLRTVSDGTLNLAVNGPDAILSGIEIYQVNTPPVLATPIPDQTAVVGQPFSYAFAANVFTDADAGTTFTYSATLSNGNGLPSWLTFTPGTRTFSGTPATTNTGVIDVKVTTSDGAGGTVNDIFQLTVNPPPFVPTFYRALNLFGPALTIDGNSWQASSGAANFSYTRTGGGEFTNVNIPLVPSTDANRTSMIRSSVWGNPLNVNVTSVPNGSYDVYLYTWADDNPTVFSASLESVQIIPAFVSNGAGSWSKLGPFRANVTDGAINLTMGGGDAVLSGLEIWTAPGSPPVVSNEIVDRVILAGESFTYLIPSNTFTDPDAGTILTYTASLADGSALPPWLTFNVSTHTFSGTPLASNAAALNVKVTASDGTGGSASDVFLLTINTGVYNLYRAINLNGSSLSIDGHSWQGSSGAANLSVTNGNPFNLQTALVSPATDANRATMIRSGVWGSLSVAVSSMPAGDYAVWVYTWEDNSPAVFSFTLEGTPAVTNHNSGSTGTWSKLGPFLRTVSDGTLNLAVNGPEAIISGIEIYAVGSMSVPVTGINLAPATASITVGEMLQLYATIEPANATNSAVAWSSSNTTVATVDSNGLVTAIGVGSADITAASGGITASSAILVASAPVASLDDVLDRFAFQYKYDGRKRMTQKKVPGADWVYMVYDDRDRLVMTQDGNQRDKTPHEWTFTKYDALNRPVLTGVYKDDRTLPAMQEYVNQFYVLADASGNDDEWFEVAGTTVHKYSSNAFPKVTNESDYLTVTYYDNYDFKAGLNQEIYGYDHTQLTASGDNKAQDENNFMRVNGQVTGTKVKNLETGDWYLTVNYFDNRYRLIQSVADNAKGGTTRITNVYDFVGKVLRTKTDLTTASGPVAATERKLTYDRAGRILDTYHKIGDNQFTQISGARYNELGQLVMKGLHGDGSNSYMQNVDYRYNIRGWLTRINNSDLSRDDLGSRDFFGMNIGYEDVLGTEGAQSQFNGNISVVKYASNIGFGNYDGQTLVTQPNERGYKFRYDALNRLQDADHLERLTDWTDASSFDENGITYDMNGNILTLARSGTHGSGMDALGYQYVGNRLLAVNDAGDDEEGFRDGNTGTDYIYDKNGNMISDLNKGISQITYNHLNLPAKVLKNTGEYIRYHYDAAGTKLSQAVYNASNARQKNSEYLGEYFYENDTLKFVRHDEGRLVPHEDNFRYEYTIKDHLGNTRVAFSSWKGEDIFTATMETDTQEQEERDFRNYSSTINDLLDHTDSGTDYERVLLLNGGNNRQVGMAKSFAVMTNDQVRAKVYAKYVGTSGQTSALGGFAAALTGAFGLAPAGVIDGPTAYSALNNIGTILASGDHPGGDDDAPKAFINILVFDKNYNLINFAFDQLGAEYEQTGVDKAAHDELSVQVTVSEPGYVYVFLSNEEPNELQVGFDDFEVAHYKNPVLELEDYYPFGLTFNSYQRENSVYNKYQYNGKELQSELGLNWNDYGARMYMSDIGRWGVIDNSSEKGPNFSPYGYAFNNPVRFLDPDGNWPWESKNIRQARRFARETGGEFSKNGKSATVNIYKTSTYYNVIDDYVAGAYEGGHPEGGLTYEDQSNLWLIRFEEGGSYDNLFGPEELQANVAIAATLEEFIVMIPGLEGLFSGKGSGNTINIKELADLILKSTDGKKENPKREAREKARKAREEQPASEDYAKYKAKGLEKAKGKDARRRGHDSKEAGGGDRSKKRLDEDYDPNNH